MAHKGLGLQGRQEYSQLAATFAPRQKHDLSERECLSSYSDLEAALLTVKLPRWQD